MWRGPNGRMMALAVLVTASAACDADSMLFAEPETFFGDALSFGIWSPSGPDTCPKDVHDSFYTVGPDSLRYPTWHPAEDPVSKCNFGHEHGRDPSGSDLYSEVGDIPFGYANQHLGEGGFGADRHEDHVGHKVEWENDLPMQIGDGGSAVVSVTCDVLVKLHQGSHSPDAFTNNMHEVAYHIRCSDGTGFSATVLTPIGTPGELVAGCERDRHHQAGTANPATSPQGGGKRAIPDAACVQERILATTDGRPRFDSALRESWEISVSLKRAGGGTLASFNPYFQVMDPSRYFDPTQDRKMGRPVDLCSLPAIVGKDRCEGVPAEGVPWDDPRSPFKGTRRFVDINSNRVRNAGGPNVWYTDALGRNGQTEPRLGYIRQWVASRDNSGLDLHGPVIGRDRDYNAPGVRAPN